MNLNSIFLFSNGIFTLILGFSVAYLFFTTKVKKDVFYLLFSTGFIIYGIEILLRWLSGNYNPAEHLTGPVLSGLSLFLFSLGFWSLSRKKILLFTIIIPFYFAGYLLVCLWFANLIPYEIAILSAPLGYLPVILMLILHVAILRKMVDTFIFGWFFLLLTNFILLGQGWIADVFAIFSKLLILRGMINQDFFILSQKIKRTLNSSQVASTIFSAQEGGIRLILPSTISLKNRYNWIERKVIENNEKGKETYIFSFQDSFPHSALRRIKWINPEKTFILLFSSSAQEAKKEFTLLPMEITHIGASLTEIANKCKKTEKCCTIIITNLSLAIHSFGVESAYKMLVTKLGLLREANIDLFSFLYPETHSDQHILHLFENISDEITKL